MRRSVVVAQGSFVQLGPSLRRDQHCGFDLNRAGSIGASVSPKAKYKASNFPPADPKNFSTACRLLDPPSLARPFTPSCVKEACIRYLGLENLLSVYKKSQHPANHIAERLALYSSGTILLRGTKTFPSSALIDPRSPSKLEDVSMIQLPIKTIMSTARYPHTNP
jgi:hypothetical protein